MIEIKDLQKSFGPQKVLNNISMSITEGKIYAILGHNGSGKTTLIKSLLGLVVPDRGKILVEGESVKNNWNYRKKFGYISQIARFPQNLSITELIEMISDIRNHEVKFKDLVSLFGIEKDLHKKLGHLSGGTRQKVNVIIAMMTNSPILVCDEPTVGLDPASLIKLKELLLEYRNEGKTVILITHITNLVDELADEVFLLQDGNLNFNGTVEKLKEQESEVDLEKALAKMMEKIGHA